MIQQNPKAAGNLAMMITARDANGIPKTPIDGVLQIFLDFSRVQEATAFLLEALKGLVKIKFLFLHIYELKNGK